jgi:serine protease AprX
VTVGAAETNGTLDVRDDTVPAFAQHGNLVRSVDVVAPATHVLSLRVPGSWVDRGNPGGVVGERFIRGSGTSQAAAVTSGLAALLVQKFPTATPDQIKAYLMSTARPIGTLSTVTLGLGGLSRTLGLSGLGLATNPVTNWYAGNGVVTGLPAVTTRTLAPAIQLTLPSTGLGSLDAARGSGSLLDGGIAVTGSVEILGLSLSLGTAPAPLEGWWEGNRWTGNRWTDGSWTGNRWTGNRWTGNRWTGNRWTGNRWTGNRWTAGIWS